MTTPADLLDRLDRIAAGLARRDDALALLGLGSVGTDLGRLDRWSDLDFFVVVRPGAVAGYLADLGWLSEAAPVASAFRNTPDGHKVLYADGILCEFAVFAPERLPEIPYAGERVVWCHPDLDPATLAPVLPRPTSTDDVAWHVAEALSNLYVGLGRFHRGERLAAQRLVQVHAVDRVLAVAAALGAAGAASGEHSPRGVESDGASPGADRGRSGPGRAAPHGRRQPDPFAPERRAEWRLPDLVARLPHFVQGYDRTPESAAAILAWLHAHADVDPAMADAVLARTRTRTDA